MGGAASVRPPCATESSVGCGGRGGGRGWEGNARRGVREGEGGGRGEGGGGGEGVGGGGEGEQKVGVYFDCQ